MGLLDPTDKPNEANPEIVVSKDKWPALGFEHEVARKLRKKRKGKK